LEDDVSLIFGVLWTAGVRCLRAIAKIAEIAKSEN
jgi:hypothetical protein